MYSEKNLKIISKLRNNARESLTKISRKTNIPVSTIFDNLKVLENSVIKKHTSILDFNQLGYSNCAKITIKFHNGDKLKAKEYLKNHPNINSVFKITNGYDYLIETVFKSLYDLEAFKEKLQDKYEIIDIQTFYVVESIKREGFLENIDILD